MAKTGSESRHSRADLGTPARKRLSGSSSSENGVDGEAWSREDKVLVANGDGATGAVTPKGRVCGGGWERGTLSPSAFATRCGGSSLEATSAAGTPLRGGEGGEAENAGEEREIPGDDA